MREVLREVEKTKVLLKGYKALATVVSIPNQIYYKSKVQEYESLLNTFKRVKAYGGF